VAAAVPMVPGKAAVCPYRHGWSYAGGSPHSTFYNDLQDMDAKNTHFFGNSSFRLNQREVCNATLSGHDTFVLMPTGGACYAVVDLC
jgi:hypothetical protein